MRAQDRSGKTTRRQYLGAVLGLIAACVIAFFLIALPAHAAAGTGGIAAVARPGPAAPSVGAVPRA